MKVKLIKDIHLPSGSVIYWSRRFKRKDHWYVPIRCGKYRKERVVTISNAYRKNLTGICHRCRHFKFNDRVLPNNSVVYWSRRVKDQERWLIPVRCGGCGTERTVSQNTAGRQSFSGLCHLCASGNSVTGIRVLPSGSTIYWNDQIRQNGRRVLVRCGGSYCGGTARYIRTAEARAEGFTGLCRRCIRAGSRGSNRKGGRTADKNGYIKVRLSPTHPFYCMANKQGYVYEHRLVVAKDLSRPLGDNEIVHHKNGDKHNNRLKNLEIVTRAEHHPGYRSYKPQPVEDTSPSQNHTPRPNKDQTHRPIIQNGYIKIWLPSNHPFHCMADTRGYIYEHRLIMAEHLGRPLHGWELVHHKNRDRKDNRLENLELWIRA